MERVEVGIVGAGIHGVSTAYHLARLGVPTLLFDRAGPASGPTGRSSAVCRAYYTNTFLAQVARESLQAFRNFEELTGRDAGYRETGLLYLHPPDDEAALRAAVQRMRRIGTGVRLLDRAALAETFPSLRLEGVALGALEEHAGYADPVATTAGLAERAVELGLHTRYHTSVVDLARRSGGGAVVTTSDGDRVTCERLVLAAGPWTRELAARIGADLPLTVERHVVATFAWGDAPPLGAACADLVGGWYLRPEGEHLYLVGSLHPAARADPDAFAQSAGYEEVEALSRAVVARAPALEASQSRGGWASLYDVSPDWQPVIGEIAPGVFVDAGTSGHGFKLGPALGRFVAGMVVGRPDERLAQFHPRRFAEGTGLQAGYGSAHILG